MWESSSVDRERMVSYRGGEEMEFIFVKIFRRVGKDERRAYWRVMSVVVVLGDDVG